MRAEDIVNQLALMLPLKVDDFTENVGISQISRSGTTVTVTTVAAHNLTVGQKVNITGAEAPINITSIDRVGIVGTLVTNSDHDITENAGYNVQIEGATQPEFNGTFTLISVPNRRTIKFQMDDSGPTSASGSPDLMNGSNIYNTYSGIREVTAAPTATTFEFEVVAGSLPAFVDRAGMELRSGIRISSSVDVDRIFDAYTKQNADKAWMFVVLGDALADKSRKIDTDSTNNIQAGNYQNQRMVQNVGLVVIIPTSGQIAARKARDRCQELLSPICQCILGFKFPSLVESNNNPLQITSHGLQAYNTAFYAHQYNFEATLQLGPSDAYVPSDDVAFRDIELTMGLDVGNETFDTSIDLDDEPLP